MAPIRLQTEVSIAVSFLALTSVLLHILAPSSLRFGGFFISFPADAVITDLKGDPFNIAAEDDFVDGAPPSGSVEKFWAKVSRRLTVFALLQALIISAWSEHLQLGGEGSPYDDAFYIFATLCILAIGLRPFFSHDKIRAHARSITHLSFLLSAKVLLTLTVIALPASSEFSRNLVWDGEIILDIRRLEGLPADVFLTFFSWIIIMTTPLGPAVNYPEEKIYAPKILSSSGRFPEINVSGENSVSSFGTIFFSYSTKVFLLGQSTSLATFEQLPILPAKLRAKVNLSQMKYSMRHMKLPSVLAKPGSGFQLAYQLLRVNLVQVCIVQLISAVAGVLFYVPIALIQQFLSYLERDPGREDRGWGWFYVGGIFITQSLVVLTNAQLWSVATNNLRTRMGLQLNTLLYAKTLVRKDVSSFVKSNGSASSKSNEAQPDSGAEFSSKAEVINLMTTDVNRARDLSRFVFSMTDISIGISVGTYMLYNLLGVSAFVGLAMAMIMIPLNQMAGNLVVSYQENVMKCRDERVAATNEFLGAIRMIKSMAWERNFEKRILKVRERELKYQSQIFRLQTLWYSLGDTIPLVFALGCFWHFSVIRRQELTPTIAFTSLVVLWEIKYGLTLLPEFLVAVLRSFVSLRRIEKYLHVEEVNFISLADCGTTPRCTEVALHSATITWAQYNSSSSKKTSSTPRRSFSLVNVSATFPKGKISLVCGKIGSGKTLLLQALLGEAEVLSGQVVCPRSPVDSHALLAKVDGRDDWVVQGICAYVPQTPWLRNQSIKENILFNLPYDAERYSAVIEACALVHDFTIFEDGDESEIGEQGINLSGGQKARISLARAVYSRASTLLLDDVLSSVDMHTVHHLWDQCFKGPLLDGRTVVLVSHHIELCGPDSKLILALDDGRVQYSGPWTSFQGSNIMQAMLTSLVDITPPEPESSANDNVERTLTNVILSSLTQSNDSANATEISVPTTSVPVPRQAKKLIQDETRAEGHISKATWLSYIRATGNPGFWLVFWTLLLLSAVTPILENGWLKVWSGSDDASYRPLFYMSVYAGVVALEIIAKIAHWLIQFNGSIRASRVLYKKLLRAVLFANVRFHDTTSRGRLLNRFGKDFEAVDIVLANELGRTWMIGISLLITLSTLTYIGGRLFILVALIIIAIAFHIAQIFGRIARDLRRLSSITSSPLFSIYGETISGLSVIRAFGMSTKFLRDMVVHADTNMNPTYWSAGLNRWFSIRFQLAAASLLGLIAMIVFLSPAIDASWAGLALAFASTWTLDLYWFVRRWVEVDQVMVALERIEEYSNLPPEAAAFSEARPPAAWPSSGSIQCENLSVKYNSDLPYVLHGLSFEIKAGEKIGVVGRTGSGKSTLALALMRFVEAGTGRIVIDGVDISMIGLTDLRSRLTIIPQDPILLSGTLRSTLDFFEEYDDADIYQALKRVNLIAEHSGDSVLSLANKSTIFQDLDTPVSELGDNFSVGEKQLLCMARALLRRSKILLMDEATASVDYATDEIISRTIREEFVDSTIVTIAHRLHTVAGYDRIMVMDEGRVVEFDSPRKLIRDESSRFHRLCKAAGPEEFAKLSAMTG